jgi:hypothetical protein
MFLQWPYKEIDDDDDDYSQRKETDLVRSAGVGTERRCAMRRSFCKQTIRCLSQSMGFMRIKASAVRKKGPSTSNGSFVVTSGRAGKFCKSFSSRSTCRLLHHTLRMRERENEREKDLRGENIENGVNLIGDETTVGFSSSTIRIFAEGLQIDKAKQ